MDKKLHTSNLGLSILGVSLGVGMVVVGLTIADAFKEVRLSNHVVDVKGYAEKAIVSDIGEWGFCIIAQGSTVEEAFAAIKLAQDKTHNYLKSHNVQLSQIATEPMSLQTVFKTIPASDAYSRIRESNEVELYKVTLNIKISMADVHLLEKIAGDSHVLGEDGVILNTRHLSFFCTDIANIKTELLGEATRNAVLRAEQLANNSGGKLGALQGARQGVFQITPENSTDVADYGISDTTSINKKAKSVAAVTFAIKK